MALASCCSGVDERRVEVHEYAADGTFEREGGAVGAEGSRDAR